MSRRGRLWSALPLEQLGNCLPRQQHNCGRKEYFDNSGKFALMFLKHELGVSDEKLVEHINHNPTLQLFCGMRPGGMELIRDTGIVSRIRGFMAHHADLEQVQRILLDHWKVDTGNQHFLKMDATCFKSYIRYPADVKLLWECCEWVYARQFKAALNKDRATRLEGSFGNQKNHYGLQKVRARNGPNEKVWIFFGVFTTNAILISKKRDGKAARGKVPLAA